MSVVSPQDDLSRLAVTANAEHAAFETTQTAALAHAIAAGEALIEAKCMLGHGEWLPWVEANCDFGERTAQRYMRIARNTSRVSDLRTVREALATLADPSAPRVYEPGRYDPYAGRETLVVAPEPEPDEPLGNTKGPHADYAKCWLRVPWVTECPCCGADLYAPRGPDRRHRTTENES
jgi:hypothetical protein